MGRNNSKASDKAGKNEVNKTGLYWPGKKTEVEKTALPFQTVETINESKADRDKLTLFRQQGEPAPGWRNKLIWGDNKYIKASLLKEFAGKINLIYIDPPFATGADFSINIKLGDIKWTKEASVIEEKAYRDTWGKGLDSYLQMMYDRLVLMRELLADNGSIYVHLDWHVGHYVKIIMDEIFGKDSFVNEIIWYYYNKYSTAERSLPRAHDNILLYSKTGNHIMNELRIKRDKPVKQLQRVNVNGVLKNVKDENGRVVYRIVDDKKADDVWRIPQLQYASPEWTGYDTQKHHELIERIIELGSNKGSLVADFFCGSGTTLAVAEKLGRRWIGSDLSKFAIHTTRKRLLDMSDCKPFEVLNLGKYQKAKLKENGISRYVDFILKLYRAESMSGYTTIHGKKAGRMIHIGDVDSIVTEREIIEVVKECASAGVKHVDILGWDFEMGLHDLVDRIGDEHSVKIRLVQIPREALEVRDVAREEIKFFDLNYLEIKASVKSKELKVELKEFVISNPEYLPDDVRKKVKKFTDYIDYWAVDFNYKNDTFHNMWQSFRTRKHPSLETKSYHVYEKPGTYQVLVKVVDIFGNDTNKIVEVKI